MLVLDPWMRASLAAVRALGRAPEFSVGVAGADLGRLEAGPAASSRWVECYDVLPDPNGPQERFQDALVDLVRRRGYDVVMSTSDATLARLSRLQLPVPTFPDLGHAYQALTDKSGLAKVCAQAGVPYPQTRRPRDRDEAALLVSELGLPVVVKAESTARAGAGDVRMARGARVCTRATDAVDEVGALLDAGLVAVVQQRVPFAEKLNAVIVRTPDGGLYRYAHRVLREVPVSGGTGVTLETIDAATGPGAEAVELLDRACEAAGYTGLAQAEFYRSSTDGLLYLIDVNPRLWGSTWFAERLGQRAVERGIRAALQLPPVGSTPYRLGRRYHTPIGELRWLREQGSRAAGLGALARDTRPWDVFEFLDARDPAPVAVLVWLLLTGRLHGRAD